MLESQVLMFHLAGNFNCPSLPRGPENARITLVIVLEKSGSNQLSTNRLAKAWHLGSI